MTEALTNLFKKYAHRSPGLQSADLEEMQRSMSLLVAEFGVPESEAIATIESGIRRRLGLDAPMPDNECTEAVAVADLAPRVCSTVRVKVVKLFEPRHAKIYQTGLLGDASGTVRFVSWRGNSDPPTLEQGKCYELRDVFPTVYEGKLDLNVSNATATEISEDIQVASAPGEILVGAVTRILSAGIVRRCPRDGCKKIVEIGPGGYLCPVHGWVEEPRPDLRARVVLDNGVQATIVYLPAPVVEKLTWLSITDALDLVSSAKVGGDFIVEDKIRAALFGRYIRVYAAPLSGQFYARDAEIVRSFDVIRNVDSDEPWVLKEAPDWVPSVGTRAFLAELSQVREIVKDGTDKMSPTYAVMPNGELASRFFWIGVLIDLTKRGGNLVGKINDPTGTLRIRTHHQYQSRAYLTLSQLKLPALVAIGGKLNLFKPPDSDDVHVSFIPSEVAQVSKATRLMWCEETLARGDRDSAIAEPVMKFIDEHRGDENA